MKETISILLPLPPPLNTVYNTTRNGRMYKSHEAKKYAEDLKEIYSGELLTNDVGMTIHFSLQRDRDIDSGLKVLLDSLQGVAYENDKQITRLHVTKGKAVGEPYCQVVMAEI